MTSPADQRQGTFFFNGLCEQERVIGCESTVSVWGSESPKLSFMVIFAHLTTRKS